VAAAAAAARYGPPPAKPSRLVAAPCVCVLCCSPHHRITRALLLQSGVPGAARVVQTSHTEASTVAAVQVRAFPSNTQPCRPCCVCVVFSSPSHSCLPAALRCAAGSRRRALPMSTRRAPPRARRWRRGRYVPSLALLAHAVFLTSPTCLRVLSCSFHSVVDVAHVVEVGRRWGGLAMAPCRYEHCPAIPSPCAMRV